MDTLRRKKLGKELRGVRPSNKTAHIISSNGQWVIFNEGSEKTISRYPNKSQALKEGKKILRSKNANTLVIHKSDGTVEKIEKAI